jgi:hypothetical protein
VTNLTVDIHWKEILLQPINPPGRRGIINEIRHPHRRFLLQTGQRAEHEVTRQPLLVPSMGIFTRADSPN